ncbi:hypothetical protein E2562_036897 [Oryza meyeriana var. granulata]|uniref:Uncharacterized protein n=1 Tax=Oryza meyeriana var. granulata TaxID=110450 RepID=A0A6G1ETG8_9ORYZ|nr:hypothetical protein E2562_036897 [Oryza meyeriana var. granulata]
MKKCIFSRGSGPPAMATPCCCCSPPAAKTRKRGTEAIVASPPWTNSIRARRLFRCGRDRSARARSGPPAAATLRHRYSPQAAETRKRGAKDVVGSPP